MTYQANNIRGQWKRAFCSATMVGFGGIGGIIAALIFQEKHAPRYIPGIWATIGFQALLIALAGLLTWHFARRNAEVRSGKGLVEGREGFFFTL